MPTTTAFRGGASVRALKEGDTSITITAGSIVKTIPVSVWGNKWVLPTLPATRNGITFTAAGDGMVHAKGTATDWATILVTQDLPAGEYTLEHTLVDGVGLFCELKSTDGRIDLFSHGTVKATIPAATTGCSSVSRPARPWTQPSPQFSGNSTKAPILGPSP